MKILLLSLVVLLSACSTTVPVTAKFPEPPGLSATAPCANLEKLENNTKLSDVSKIVVSNYSKYYECAVKTDTWIEWYNVQKNIFERLK